MAASQTASVHGKPIVCPVCGCDRFASKKIMVAGQWLQVLDMEGFGTEGIMLICDRCSHIEHFATRDSVVLAN